MGAIDLINYTFTKNAYTFDGTGTGSLVLMDAGLPQAKILNNSNYDKLVTAFETAFGLGDNIDFSAIALQTAANLSEVKGGYVDPTGLVETGATDTTATYTTDGRATIAGIKGSAD